MNSEAPLPSWRDKDLSEGNTPFRIRGKEEWRGVFIRARLIFFFHEMAVPYPNLLSTIKAIHAAMFRCELSESAYSIFVQAPSGGGKTTLARIIEQLHPRIEHPEFTEIPVLRIRIPGVVSMKGMSTALLEALGDPKSNSGNHKVLMARALPLLRKAKTAAVIIDNIQDITEKRASGGIRQLGSWLRDFSDDFGRTVVLLGTNEGAPVLDAYVQAKRRAPGRKFISYFSVPSPTFTRFLKELDERLPLAEMCDLASPELAIPIGYATGGVQDYLFKLIGFAIPCAVKAGREYLTREDLAQGFDQLFLDSGKGANPFRDSVDHVLSRPGEPLAGFVPPPPETP